MIDLWQNESDLLSFRTPYTMCVSFIGDRPAAASVSIYIQFAVLSVDSHWGKDLSRVFCIRRQTKSNGSAKETMMNGMNTQNECYECHFYQRAFDSNLLFAILNWITAVVLCNVITFGTFPSGKKDVQFCLSTRLKCSWLPWEFDIDARASMMCISSISISVRDQNHLSHPMNYEFNKICLERSGDISIYEIELMKSEKKNESYQFFSTFQ